MDHSGNAGDSVLISPYLSILNETIEVILPRAGNNSI